MRVSEPWLLICGFRRLLPGTCVKGIRQTERIPQRPHVLACGRGHRLRARRHDPVLAGWLVQAKVTLHVVVSMCGLYPVGVICAVTDCWSWIRTWPRSWPKRRRCSARRRELGDGRLRPHLDRWIQKLRLNLISDQ